MAASQEIPDADRDRILELHAQGMSRNDIAREVGRSGSTVTKVVHAAGLSFDRTSTQAATQAKKADAAALRAQLELDYLADAQRLRQQIWQPHEYFDWGGKDHDFDTHTTTEPTPVDKLKLMQASTSAMTASLRIEQARADGGVTEARSLVGDLAAYFGLKPTPAEA